jgi:hypothetical protein
MENRVRIRWGRLLHNGLFRQLLPMYGKRGSNPERICQMIPARICGVRMHQNAQVSVVKHQPWHQHWKYVRSEGYLKHCLIVRAYFHVMPATQGDGKTFVYPCSQPLGL